MTDQLLLQRPHERNAHNRTVPSGVWLELKVA
jgi:hypothetical protein